MKSLSSLTSKVLLANTRSLVSEERRATLALIEHLEEISHRKLYAELGYASLWEFATLELGLSEGAAQRRIQAMKLLRDVPEAKASIESGKLSLSNAAKVQSFRQAEKKLGRTVNPSELVAKIESLSQRDCEKKLFEISPEALPRERERIVSAFEERELKLVVSPELYEKLQRIKGHLAHAIPEATYAQLIDRMSDEVLARLEKNKGITQSTAAAAVTTARPLPAGKRVYLPVALRKTVWARSGGRCEIQHAGRHCNSRYRLELDHIIPLAMGGANDPMNLRLLCREHNQYEAWRKLGPERMRRSA
jgi:5-methylcytosine-specific restriction endonuclease McrA